MKATLALAILSLALFALPGQAFAHATDDATDAQYAPQTQVVPPAPVAPPAQVPAAEKPEKPKKIQAALGAGQAGAPAERVAVPSAGPSLPFTGLDVAALVVVAMALAGTGVVLRRLATIGDSEK